MQTRTPERALERIASGSNLLSPLQSSAFGPAVPLAPIAIRTCQNLAAARRPGAIEHPKRLVDHGAQMARRFLDKRREPSDRELAVRATTRRMRARRISPGLRYLAGSPL